MNVQIHLTHDSWRSNETSHARGSAFEGASLRDANSLAGRIAQVSTPAEFRVTVSELNGYFALIRTFGNNILAAVDRLRSIPLFYGARGDKLFLSDSADWVLKCIGEQERDPVAEIELLLAGYVTGSETLYPGVRQVMPGQILHAEFHANGWIVFQEPYFVYRPKNPDTQEGDGRDWFTSLDEVTEEVIKRLVRWADGRTIVLPLSGGHDSRMILLMLKRLGYRDVIAYSYGRPGNAESEISRRVAEQLGYPWEFVEYNNEAWANWYRSSDCAAYSTTAGNLSTLPHLQDWPAVGDLHRRGVLPRDAVFVPGHSGDMLAGSHIPLEFVSRRYIGEKMFLDTMLRRHYMLWDWQRLAPALDPILRERALNVVPGLPVESVRDASSTAETWNWRERQTKYIVNSVRVYDFFGYEWWLPLWDNEFIRFWAGVPLDLKLGKSLWAQYVAWQSQSLVTERGIWSAENLGQRRWRPLIHRIKRNPFAYEIARDIHNRIVSPIMRRAWIKREYDHHPLAWYGLVPREQFERLYTGRETIRSFLALKTLGYDSFQDAYERLRPQLTLLNAGG